MTKRAGEESEKGRAGTQPRAVRGAHWTETSGRVKCLLVNAGGCVDVATTRTSGSSIGEGGGGVGWGRGSEVLVGVKLKDK